MDDRLVKVREIPGTAAIETEWVSISCMKNFIWKKQLAQWVSGLFTARQKHRRERISMQCLAMLSRNSQYLLRGFGAEPGNETWVQTSHLSRSSSQSIGERRERRRAVKGESHFVCWKSDYQCCLDCYRIMLVDCNNRSLPWRIVGLLER